MMNERTMQLQEDKDLLLENQAADKERFEQQLNDLQRKKQHYKEKMEEFKQKVSDQNSARNSLHQSICDLEKDFGDFEI